MKKHRSVKFQHDSRETMEGAGVRLRRAFGSSEQGRLDPFLMLDDFRSNNPEDYLAGFPWHPHRGIETVTYMLEGRVEHEDSLGHKGKILGGDVQWMTSGSGIVHSEMPKKDKGPLSGFQLWVNLPKSEKMMDPRYQEVPESRIPAALLADGSRIRVVAGEIAGIRGPVRDIVAQPEFFDVNLPQGALFEHQVKDGHTAFVYVIEGQGLFGADKTPAANHRLLLFDDKGSVRVESPEGSVRFLLLSGRPIGEPIAWYGPIVMNTQEELETAFREYQEGTFIKRGNRRNVR